MNERRQGSVRATTVCFMFCLAREDLTIVLNQFPTLRASLEARARERLQELYLSEKRPLETILALFSDADIDSQLEESESESETSGVIYMKESKQVRGSGPTLYTDSDGNQTNLTNLSTFNSTFLHTTPALVDEGRVLVDGEINRLKNSSQESCHSVTTPSTM